MKKNSIVRKLAVLAVFALSLSLTQCIFVPFRGPDSSPSGHSTVQVGTNNTGNRGVNAPKPKYSVGQQISFNGTIRAAGMGNFSFVEDGSGTQFGIVNFAKDKSNWMQKNMNHHVRATLRITRVESYKSYDAELIGYDD